MTYGRLRFEVEIIPELNLVFYYDGYELGFIPLDGKTPDEILTEKGFKRVGRWRISEKTKQPLRASVEYGDWVRPGRIQEDKRLSAWSDGEFINISRRGERVSTISVTSPDKLDKALDDHGYKRLTVWDPPIEFQMDDTYPYSYCDIEEKSR